MRLPGRRAWIVGLLVGSALLNVGLVAFVARAFGLRAVLVRLDLLPMSAARRPFQERDEARFRKLPGGPGGVYFAGESHAAIGPWAELYSDVHNRGIGNEKTVNLLARLDEITARRPDKLFLMIGTNDLAASASPARVVENFRAILGRVRAESPSTAVFVASVLPVNRDYPDPVRYTNADVREVNRGLGALVLEFPNARFVDLTDLLVDARGDLRPEFTSDGMHLTIDGYLAIRERFDPLVAGGPTVAPGGTKLK